MILRSRPWPTSPTLASLSSRILSAPEIAGIGDRHFLIPVEAVERVCGGFVTSEQSREKVRGAPELDPNIRLQPDLRRGIYEYYGYPSPS
jgi:hypothetical protein